MYPPVYWRHLANTITIVHTGAIWRIQLNPCFLRPTRVHNSNGKSIGLVVSAQLTAKSPYILQLATLSPKIAPSHGGSVPQLTRFLGPIRAHNPNGISIASAVFAQTTADCPHTLQWDAPSPSKLRCSLIICSLNITSGQNNLT